MKGGIVQGIKGEGECYERAITGCIVHEFVERHCCRHVVIRIHWKESVTREGIGEGGSDCVKETVTRE